MKILKKMTLVMIVISMLFSCVPVGVSAQVPNSDYEKDVELGEIAVNLLNRRGNHSVGEEKYADNKIGDLNGLLDDPGQFTKDTFAEIGVRLREYLEKSGEVVEDLYHNNFYFRTARSFKDATAWIFADMFSKEDEILEEVIYERTGYEGFQYLGEFSRADSGAYLPARIILQNSGYSSGSLAVIYDNDLVVNGPGEVMFIFDVNSENMPTNYMDLYPPKMNVSTDTNGFVGNGPYGNFELTARDYNYNELSENSFMSTLNFNTVAERHYPYSLERFYFYFEDSVRPNSIWPSGLTYDIYSTLR